VAACSPAFATKPRVVRPADIPPGGGRVLLLVVAHADDPAFFLGGVVRMWADAGWTIHCLRVTDDAKDSVALDQVETIARNAAEFRDAAAILGISAIEDLGWPTDCLGDVSRVDLRERIIHAIRRLRPYGLVTFDPDSMFHEDNLDHKVLAEAVDEAFWCAQFDKHHPEHLAAGLGLHGVYERWYFGRSVVGVTHVFDVETTIEHQVAAVLAHPTMLANILHQHLLQAMTASASRRDLEAAREDPRPFIDAMVRAVAAEKGAPYGLPAGEVMRRARARLVNAPPGAGGD
jgi:LmbE family N-acetylglucosaminyl deacetylase